MESPKTQYVYILRCADGTFYTGWTTDLIGLGLLAAAIALNMLRAKKAAPKAAA